MTAEAVEIFVAALRSLYDHQSAVSDIHWSSYSEVENIKKGEVSR